MRITVTHVIVTPFGTLHHLSARTRRRLDFSRVHIRNLLPAEQPPQSHIISIHPSITPFLHTTQTLNAPQLHRRVQFSFLTRSTLRRTTVYNPTTCMHTRAFTILLTLLHTHVHRNFRIAFARDTQSHHGANGGYLRLYIPRRCNAAYFKTSLEEYECRLRLECRGELARARCSVR